MLAGPRSGRGLVILFLVVTILPALALVALGVRLLEQERVLAEQRRRESLDRAAGHAVLVLEQELASLRRQLAAGEWDPKKLPDDSATLAIRGQSVHASPPGRLPYLPTTAALREIPESPFTETESIEFARQDLPEAFSSPGVYRFGDLEADFDRAEVRRAGNPVDLTALEFRLLKVFIERRGRVLSRAQLS